MRAVLVAVTTVVAASMIGCSHPGSDSSPGSGGSGGAGPGTGGMAGAAGTSGVTGSGGMLGTGGVTGSGGTATGGRSGAGGAAGRGGATGAAGVTGSGGGPMQCVPACPAGYTCDVSGGGICKGGTAANLTFDVKAFPVSGTVTLNGANPVSSTTSCYSSSAGTNYPRGQVTLTDTAHGVSFTADLQGCTNTTATFSTTVFPGTYKVWVSGQYSDLPGDSYLASNALAVGGAVANLAYDVKAFSVSGAVTLNGANPVSSTTSCYSSSAGTNYPRGQVTLTDTTQGVSFTADLQGCTNTTATFSTTVFPGTYKVWVSGQYSNLPGDSYLAINALVIGGAVANLAYDVKAFSVSGAVTLNGANPVSSTTSCYSSSAGTNYPRGQVTLTDTTQGVSFTADLQGCTNTTATFSTTVFPGTYKVWVSGQYSDLPGDSYLASAGLAVGAAMANLAYDVKAYPVSGTVTLNGANPVSSTTSCYSSGAGTNYPRGQVTLTDTTQGVSFTADLQGCTNTTATFSTTVFPGTYEVTITGQYSDLPGASYLAVSRIVVP